MVPGIPSPESAGAGAEALITALFALNGTALPPRRPRTPPPRPGYTRVTSDDVADE